MPKPLLPGTLSTNPGIVATNTLFGPPGPPGLEFNRIFQTLDAVPLLAIAFPVVDGEVLSLRFIVTVHSTDASGAVMGEWGIKVACKKVGGILMHAYNPTIAPLFVDGAPGGPTLGFTGNDSTNLYLTGIIGTDLTWKISEFSI